MLAERMLQALQALSRGPILPDWKPPPFDLQASQAWGGEGRDDWVSEEGSGPWEG